MDYCGFGVEAELCGSRSARRVEVWPSSWLCGGAFFYHLGGRGDDGISRRAMCDTHSECFKELLQVNLAVGIH